MTPATFKAKWGKFTGKESAAYQEHFNDLCRVLGVPTPIEADPTGEDSFCFQKHVVKDAELFAIGDDGKIAETANSERGFADVWKSECFAWEYKGPKEDLEKAYKQLLRYRESLLNPPLLIVCDFDRYIVRTNFNGAVQETHSFTNAEIDSPEAIRILRAALSNPDELRPKHTTAEVTEKLAKHIAEIALSLHEREAVELTDAKTRKQHHVAQRKNLRIARFLNRLVFCFFAEDTELLPKGIFSEICQIGLNDPLHFAESLEALFKCMAKGGNFGTHKIRHFNGHLFEDATVFELTPKEIQKLAEAAQADWQNIRPAIMGTLFERALDENQRRALGANYTSEEDIKTIVEPVLMAPLRREWKAFLRDLARAIVKGKGTISDRAKLAAFQKKLASIIVLDPACGSGNFLYVALQLLLGLEKEVIAIAAHLGWTFEPTVSVKQLRAIEINAYAYELAQVSVQIGSLQWRRDNGFENERTPVLRNLSGFENHDALMHETFRKKPKNLKAAQAEEHGGQDELFKVYTERAWPPCDVIVGNPPFLGGKMLRRELGDAYVKALFENFADRVRPEADLCCYWFEKARLQIEENQCRRAGLLATQGIRGGANREVLKRIKKTGDIFFAESDRPWILAGANVHVSMVGFDDGTEKARVLDGGSVNAIHANLSAVAADITSAAALAANSDIAYMGDTKGGAFDITEAQAIELLHAPNPHGQPNSDVIIPWINGLDVTRRPRRMFILDFGASRTEADCAKYEAPFAYITDHVRSERVKNKRALYAKNWWRHVELRPGMLAALAPLPRFLTMARVAKHRLFCWAESPALPDCQVFAFARADDYFLGLLHSRLHEIWALKLGTRLETRPRYTPTTCFETFPFPFLDDTGEGWQEHVARIRGAHGSSHLHNVICSAAPPITSDEYRIAVAVAAKDLNELRGRWLNPPEWTETHTLEFPGSAGGPWARFIDPATVNAATGIGTVRYPRLEPRNAECAAKLAKRTLTNLYNERPAWLDNAHKELDAAVANAYGWPADLSDEQILDRLLALNLKRAENEAMTASAKKPKAQREKQMDELI